MILIDTAAEGDANDVSSSSLFIIIILVVVLILLILLLLLLLYLYRDRRFKLDELFLDSSVGSGVSMVSMGVW